MSSFDITLAEAQQRTQNFQFAYADCNKAVCIPKNEVIDLLNQPGCIGLRIYFALNDSTTPHVITTVLVGIQDSNGGQDLRHATDMLPSVSNPSCKIKDNVVVCPPNCNCSL